MYFPVSYRALAVDLAESVLILAPQSYVPIMVLFFLCFMSVVGLPYVMAPASPPLFSLFLNLCASFNVSTTR